MKEKYFLCPECNKKMTCDILDTGSTIKMVLKCHNGLCGARSVLELSDNKRTDGKPVKNSDLYPIIKGYLKDLRKRVRHSDYHDYEWRYDAAGELYSQVDGQITIDDVCKEF